MAVQRKDDKKDKSDYEEFSEFLQKVPQRERGSRLPSAATPLLCFVV